MEVSNPTSEKVEVEQLQDVAKNNLDTSGVETGSDRAIGSFVDVDEKKVLRKVLIFPISLASGTMLTQYWYRWTLGSFPCSQRSISFLSSIVSIVSLL